MITAFTGFFLPVCHSRGSNIFFFSFNALATTTNALAVLVF